MFHEHALNTQTHKEEVEEKEENIFDYDFSNIAWRYQSLRSLQIKRQLILGQV